jgi:hypothetical protein
MTGFSLLPLAPFVRRYVYVDMVDKFQQNLFVHLSDDRDDEQSTTAASDCSPVCL